MTDAHNTRYCLASGGADGTSGWAANSSSTRHDPRTTNSCEEKLMAWQLGFSLECKAPVIEFLNAPKEMPLFGISFNMPVDPASMPKRGRIENRWRWSTPIPDLFMAPGLNAVSQRFHDLVEQFELGVHQFFPLQLFKSDGTPVGGNYYIFNCAVGVDAIIFKNTGASWSKDVDGVPIVRTGMRKQFEISRPAIGNRSLWCGKTVAQTKLFASDDFYAAMTGAAITGFKELYRPEIDEPWIAEENLQPLLRWGAERN